MQFCGLQRGEDLESGVTGDVESKYKKMYEEDINPFTAFSKKVCVWFSFICCLASLFEQKHHLRNMHKA